MNKSINKTIDSIKKFFDGNFAFILINIVFLFICLVFIRIINNYTLVSSNKVVYYLLYAVVAIVYIGLCFLIKYINIKKVKLENQFLIFGIIFGICYSIIIPMWGTPDEPTHYLRANEISHGHLISEKIDNQVGDYLPTNTHELYDFDVFSIKYSKVFSKIELKESNEYAFHGFANTALYSYVCYLPQSIGILIGRGLRLPMLIGAYLGRLFNYLTWLFIMYMAIKYIPFGKRIVFMVAFLPMQMQEAICLSPDCLINSLSIGLIAYVIYHMHKNKKLDTKDYLLGSLITILISLLKIVYLPLCLLVFLIPKERFNSAKDKYIKIGILAAVCVLLNLIWLKISSGFLIEFNEGVNSSLQVSGILTHPFNYIRVLLHTYRQSGYLYITQLLGAALGWYNIGTSSYMMLFYLLVMIYVAFKEKKVELKKYSKLMFLFIIITIGLLISTSLYVQWTPLNYTEVQGIQGRYFLPVLLLGLFLFTRNNKNKDMIFKWEYVELLIILVNIVSLIALFARQIF